ncbi:MAG TPA: hypothetical protein VK858_18980 [Longimicrobiales bacterium]|nr:hypothetical protein [Longimicrobiales bacterium]
MRARELYRERTGWPWWIHLVVLVAVGGVLYGAWIEGGQGASATGLPMPTIVATVALVGLLYLFLGGLTVVLEPDRLRVGLGRGWPVRTAILLQDIETLESVEYRPLRDFGGWGVRGSRRRRVWSARGNQAVRLSLTDGRTVYIGSDHPRTLENRIRQAMGV